MYQRRFHGGKLPGEIEASLRLISPEFNSRACKSAAMIGWAISMGVTSLLLPQQGDTARAAEPAFAESTATNSALSEAAVVSPSHKAEPLVSEVSKPQAVEPKAEILSNPAPSVSEHKTQSRENLGQDSPNSKTLVSTTDKIFKSSFAFSEGKGVKNPPANDIGHEVKAEDTVKKLSKFDNVDSTESQQPAPKAENKAEISSQAALSNPLPVQELDRVPGKGNRVLKASSDNSLNRLKQQRDRLQNSLAELGTEESSDTSEQVKGHTALVNQHLQPSAIAEPAVEAKDLPVSQGLKAVSVPSPVLSSTPSQQTPLANESLAATVPNSGLSPTLSQPKVIEPKAAIVLSEAITPPSSLETPKVKVTAPLIATSEVPKLVVVAPQAATAPARVEQIKSREPLNVIALGHDVSPAGSTGMKHVETPNQLQLSQQQKTQSIALVPSIKLTPNDAVLGQSSKLAAPSLAQAESTKSHQDTKPGNTPDSLASTLMPTSVPNSTILVSSTPNKSPTFKAVPQDNPYIDKLRIEVLRLREQYVPQKQDAQANLVAQAVPTPIPIPVLAPLNNTKPQELYQVQKQGSQAKVELQGTDAIEIAVPPPLNNSKPQEQYRAQPQAAQANIRLQETPTTIEIPVPPPANNTYPGQRSSRFATGSRGSEDYNPMMQPQEGQSVSPAIPSFTGPNPYLPGSSPTFTGYNWPTKGVLTSPYGMRWGRMHKGIDIANATGTPIFASAPGVVVSAGWNSGGYGNLVDVQHPDGSLTRYGHNSRILVHVGQQVEEGQEISEMGSTGHSTGPHCHFEVHPPGQGAVNPIAFLPPR
ncbi:MAG: hypothetical protein NVSMB70_07860 [Chamaesiphon sp.]